MSAVCAASIAAAAVLAWLLTDRLWPAAVAGAVGLATSAGLAARIINRLQLDLAAAETRREALEKTLQQAQTMEAIGRLTTGVAHDFNNHLTVISSNIELTARGVDGAQDRLLRHLDAAMQGVQRAAALSTRLLTFSRRPPMEPETIDVNRLVSALSELLRRTLGDRVDLEVRLPAQPWCVWADVSQMENAILSLVVNVRERVRDGRTLLLAIGNMRVDEAVPREAGHLVGAAGEYVQVAVSERGVAAPHSPANNDEWHADLSMARCFARQAGGWLQWSGIAAALFLPRYVPPVLAGLPRRRTRDRATILVVEDDAAVRTACSESLRALGYAVLEAPDAMEAFRLIADHGGIDLLLTDLGLPGGVSGRMLADAARHADATIRVLFTTGFDDHGLADAKGSMLLRKPFDSARLASVVREMLAGAAVTGRSEPVDRDVLRAG